MLLQAAVALGEHISRTFGGGAAAMVVVVASSPDSPQQPERLAGFDEGIRMAIRRMTTPAIGTSQQI
jgi:ABC-type sugar transport system substrate-binding protein